MQTQEYDLSVIIPSYLEEENLRVILPRLKGVLSLLDMASEVIVVDSLEQLDNSEKVCLENQVNYAKRENSNYYGDAIRTGVKLARGKYIIFMDADGSHSPEFILTLIPYRNDYDVVMASRYVDGGMTDNNKLLILMSKMVNVLYSVVLGLNCKDVSNSFKLYSASLLKDLSLYSNNFEIIEEMLFKVKRRKKALKIKEVPYFFKQRMFGHSKRNLFLFAISYFVTLIKLRVRG